MNQKLKMKKHIPSSVSWTFVGWLWRLLCRRRFVLGRPLGALRSTLRNLPRLRRKCQKIKRGAYFSEESAFYVVDFTAGNVSKFLHNDL